MIQAAFYSDTGKTRERNEDNYYIDGLGIRDIGEPHTEGCLTFEVPFLAVLLDGMGGEACGQEASLCAAVCAQECQNLLLGADNEEKFRDQVYAYIHRAGRSIWNMLEEKGESGGGSTCAGIALWDQWMAYFWLGDSRIYRVRDGLIMRLTRDHSIGMDRVMHGRLTEEEARKTIQWHMLTRFIGLAGGDPPDIYFGGLLPGDRFLLCSDGLTDFCGDGEIREIMLEEGCGAAKKLALLAMERGGSDNVTAVIVEV